MASVTKMFWYSGGGYIFKGSFSFYVRSPRDYYYGDQPKWYLNGFGVMDDHGYTEGKDIWKDKMSAINVARNYVAREIKDQQKALDKLRLKLKALDIQADPIGDCPAAP